MSTADIQTVVDLVREVFDEAKDRIEIVDVGLWSNGLPALGLKWASGGVVLTHVLTTKDGALVLGSTRQPLSKEQVRVLFGLA